MTPDVQKQLSLLYARIREIERRLLDLEDDVDTEKRTESRLRRAWLHLVGRVKKQ
jgi:hypothetical protein